MDTIQKLHDVREWAKANIAPHKFDDIIISYLADQIIFKRYYRFTDLTKEEYGRLIKTCLKQSPYSLKLIETKKVVKPWPDKSCFEAKFQLKA